MLTSQQMEAAFNETVAKPSSPSLSNLSNGELQSLHTDLVKQRTAISDDAPRADKAGLTTKIRNAEKQLKERGVKFTAYNPPKAKQVALDGLSDEQLREEFAKALEAYTNGTSGKKSSYNKRMKAIVALTKERETAKPTRRSRKSS